MALKIAAEEVGFIGDGKRRNVGGLEKSEEDERAIGEIVLKGDLLARDVVAGKQRFFYEKNFVMIPAGDFDGRDGSNCFGNDHEKLLQVGEHVLRQEEIGREEFRKMDKEGMCEAETEGRKTAPEWSNCGTGRELVIVGSNE